MVIANGQPLFADSMGRVIRQCSRFQLIGQAAEGRAALRLVRALRPDVVVLGPSLGIVGGQRVGDLLMTEGVPTRLLFVGDDIDQAAAYDLLGEGAAGFLPKTTSAEQLCEAILAVAAGGVFLAHETQTAIAREIRLRTSDDRPVLSPREREVLCRIAAGESVPAIAQAMHLSVSTIKTYVTHLYEKLGVSDRAAAVAVAMRRGLLD